MSRIAIILLLALLSGCIYIPWYEPEPYQEEKLNKIKPRETTREQIVELFGQPGVSRKEGTIWIYSEDRYLGTLIGKGIVPIVDDQFLIVEFEQDTVQYFELVEKMGGIWRSGCSSNDICLVPRGEDSSDWSVASSGDDDKKSKQFQEEVDKCSVYIYIYRTYTHYSLSMGSLKNIHLGNGAYINTFLQPGMHSLTVDYQLSKGHEQSLHGKFEISCVARSKRYIKITLKGRWGWKQPNKIMITEEDEDSGRKAVEKRFLVIFP
jgi:hypothetical protein